MKAGMMRKTPLKIIRQESNVIDDEFSIDNFRAEINNWLGEFSALYLSNEYAFRVAFHNRSIDSRSHLECDWIKKIFDFEAFIFERNRSIASHIFETYDLPKMGPKHTKRMWDIFEDNFREPSYFAKALCYDNTLFPDIPEQFQLPISGLTRPIDLPIPVRKNFAAGYAKSFVRFDLILREHCRTVLLHLYEYERAAKESGFAYLEMTEVCTSAAKESIYASLVSHLPIMRLNLLALNETGPNAFDRAQVNNDFISLNMEIGSKLAPIESAELEPERLGKYGITEVYLPYWKTKIESKSALSKILSKKPVDLLWDATWEICHELISNHTKPFFQRMADEMCHQIFKAYLLDGVSFGSQDSQYLASSELAADFIPFWMKRLFESLEGNLPKLALTVDFFYNVMAKHGIRCDALGLVAYHMKSQGIEVFPRSPMN